MSDGELIRRGDALALQRYVLDELEAEDARKTGWIKADAIAALPAQGVRVRALEWADYEEIVRDAQSGMHYASRALNGFNAYFVMQDGVQFRWWSTGLRAPWQLDPVFVKISGVMHPTFDAAKAAAQADYERRILAALEPAEMAGVDALKDALASLDMARDRLAKARERIAALEVPDTASELANQRALAIIDAIREGRDGGAKHE